MERRVDRLGERPDGQRFRESGHALEQHVAAGEKTDEKSVNHVFLTDDASRDLARDILYETGISRRSDLSSSSQGAVGVKCRTRLRCPSNLQCRDRSAAPPSSASYPALKGRCPSPSSYVSANSDQRLDQRQFARRKWP